MIQCNIFVLVLCTEPVCRCVIAVKVTIISILAVFTYQMMRTIKTSLTVPNKKVVPEFIANISFHVEHSFIIKVCGFGLNYESEVSCRGLIQQGLD